jgi:hypothetical protein
MREMYVCTHTIGKTTEGSHKSLHTVKRCVNPGKPKRLFHPIKMDARMNIGAYLVMGGRSKSSILTSLRPRSVSIGMSARNLTARTITTRVIRSRTYRYGFGTFQNRGA